jgi:uncharacterized membrane protein (DUF2068 family)
MSENEGISPRATGMRLIVVYKYGKAVAEVLLAVAIMVLVLTGSVVRAHELAAAIRAHVVHHWSIKLAELVMSSLTPRHLWFIVAALFGDSLVSAFEGWALNRGHLWASWVVVAATSLLLPLEVIELSHRFTAGRVLLFVINLAIVLYLVRGALREHRARHPAPLV